MVRLYTRLWDEDEAMMQHRQAFLDGSAAPVARRTGARVRLGPADALRATLPALFDVDGDPYRVVATARGLAAHTAVCPHWGASLADAAIERGAVVCPWHGYRYDLESGRGPAGQACRLLVRAAVEIDGAGVAWLLTR